MVQAVRKFVTIQPGGRVDLVSSELPVGRQAEVIVLLTGAPSQPAINYLASFGSGRGAFTSGQAADAFLRTERDAWEL